MVQTGILLIDKPAGISSAQAVGRIKRTFHLTRKDKIGHAGTLDPGATGLLICLLGRATKLSSFIGGGLKEYRGVLRLGVSTSTDDLDGEVVEEFRGALPDFSQVSEEVKKLEGTIMQVPPSVSAVKVDGKRAYARVRSGETIELKAKPVRVKKFEVTPAERDGDFEYTVQCGSGTYVRALARDLGTALGVGGTIVSLRRTGSFPFTVGDAEPLEEAKVESLKAWAGAFQHLPTLQISERGCDDIFLGNLRRVVPEVMSLLGKNEVDDDLFLFGKKDSNNSFSPLGLLRREQGQFSTAFLDIETHSGSERSVTKGDSMKNSTTREIEKGALAV